MNIQLSDHFTYRKIIRFTLPSVVMMVFTSIYGVVDGFFVSNYVGKIAFAAVNLMWPFVMMLSTLGFMFGTGGSALVSKTMGEGDREKAHRLFSLFVYTPMIASVVMSIAGQCVLRPLAMWLGAEGELLENCVLYGRILLSATPLCTLQMEFQSFFVTAERPTLGLIVTVLSGVANMVLDALWVGLWDGGLAGAATATAISQAVGALIPIFYFALPNTSLLRLTRTRFDGRALLKACTNGSSELMTNLSMSLVNMLFNVQLIAYAGEDGLSAFGVLTYVNLIFLSVSIGLSIGTAPIVGFHFGAEHHDELRNVLHKCLWIIGWSSVGMCLLGEVLARPLSWVFVGYDEALLALTQRAFSVFSFSFLFAGVGIYGSSFFTALNNGFTSALISFLRTLVFQIAAVYLLPLFCGLDGIWMSVPVAECLACLLTISLLVSNREKYHYA